jgi:hypothetical protein
MDTEHPKLIKVISEKQNANVGWTKLRVPIAII